MGTTSRLINSSFRTTLIFSCGLNLIKCNAITGPLVFKDEKGIFHQLCFLKRAKKLTNITPNRHEWRFKMFRFFKPKASDDLMAEMLLPKVN